jgi:hypothetical protein
MTESVSGRDMPERIESASLARVVTSQEEASESDQDLGEPVLLLFCVSSVKDTCAHCDECPCGALLW